MMFIAFIVAFALLIAGNIAIRIAGLRRLQFAYNSAFLAMLSAMLAYMLLTGYSAVRLGFLSFNPFSLFVGLLFSVGMLFINFIAYEYRDQFEDFALLGSFVIAGMYAVVFSVNFVTIFIGMELMTLPSVFMILLERRSLEAGMKMFIMASISIAIFSFALVLFYGSTGSIALGLAGMQKSAMLAFALGLFVVALGFEASIFPFNVWVPDVYAGAQPYVAAMLGGINKKVGFVALMLIFLVAFSSYAASWKYVIALLSVITMFYGNLLALKQENVKRMLAYSSISQAGYILIGIATVSGFGTAASLVQIFAHTFAFIGLFAIVSWLGFKNRTMIDDFIGLGNENAIAAFAMSIMMLSLVGMPFTIGFIGKFLLFTGAISGKMLWLALLGVLNSIISIYYYARVMIAAYTNKAGANKLRMGAPTMLVVVLCLGIILFFGIYPSIIINLASSAGNYLFMPLYGGH